MGPDKLRFDFTHGQRLTEDELRGVEDRVNEWIAAGLPVRAMETTLDEARAVGAMALFGEKYGDWVRMVEVGEVSRELCGGTHVASSGEIGLFHMTNETSSASNVRRIEAVTGAAAALVFRDRRRSPARTGGAPEGAGGRAAARLERLEERARPWRRWRLRRRRGGRPRRSSPPLRTWTEWRWWPGARTRPTPRRSWRCRTGCGRSSATRWWCSATAVDGRVHLVVNVAPAVVERGVKAGEVVRAAAAVVGGGGGGRDTMAQAGGRDPETPGRGAGRRRARRSSARSRP